MARPRDTIEARILRALSRPLTRKALGARLQLWPKVRLDAALAPLLAAGRVVAKERKGGRGRTATVYELAPIPVTVAYSCALNASGGSGAGATPQPGPVAVTEWVKP